MRDPDLTLSSGSHKRRVDPLPTTSRHCEQLRAHKERRRRRPALPSEKRKAARTTADVTYLSPEVYRCVSRRSSHLSLSRARRTRFLRNFPSLDLLRPSFPLSFYSLCRRFRFRSAGALRVKEHQEGQRGADRSLHPRAESVRQRASAVGSLLGARECTPLTPGYLSLVVARLKRWFLREPFW